MYTLPDIAVMLIATDGHAKIADVNSEVCRQMGYDRADLIGVGIGKYLTPESRTRMLGRLQFRESAGGFQQLPVDIQCQDGAIIAVEISTRQLFDDEGQQSGAVATLINVTQSKLAERQCVLLATELAQTHRSLTAFSRIAAAQLGQPLAMLESFVTMIEHKARPLMTPAGVQQLDQLQMEIKQYGEVLSQAAALAAVDEGEAGLHVVDLAVMLPRCVESLRAKIDACQAACVAEDALSVVIIGTSQLERVIHNLIDNAMRYRVQDRVPAMHLIVTRDGALVEISVTDNGQGVDETNSEALFESFTRDARADRLQEKGVGLAICRRIMTQAGGTIRATPGADVGSRFTLPFTDHSMV